MSNKLASKLHRLADRPTPAECTSLGVKNGHSHGLRGALTGEFRIPKKGEWYLSGAIPEAYRAPTDEMRTPYYILRLVRVETRTTEYVVPQRFVLQGRPNPENMKKIRVDELTYGDRFRVNGALWTVVDISWMKTGEDWIVARKHGPESATLGDKGYGYIGDSICSFEASQLVEFVPAM